MLLKIQVFILKKLTYAYFVPTQEPEFRCMGFFFFHVLFLFIPSQLPRNLHIGILLPS